MNAYLILKLVHVVSATLLFGTGLGTAFFLFCAHRTGDVRVIHITARHVVVADWLFTTPAVIVQPVTGLALMHVLGYRYDSLWFLTVAGLFLIAGACWIPVVVIQYRLRALTARTDGPLPPAYHRLMRWWITLGVPAFLAVLVLFVLMIFRPWLN